MRSRTQAGWVLFAILASAALAGVGPLLTLISDGRIATMDVLADPADVTGAPWYLGAGTDLRLFVWATGAALFAVATLGLWSTARRLSLGLTLMGALTLALTLDDRFMLHEVVIPANTGLPEAATYAGYLAVAVAVVLVAGPALLRQPEAPLLLLSALGLATWIGLDLLDGHGAAYRIVMESAKSFGAITWSLFPAALVVRHLRRSLITK